ncbi:hypothetical protein NA57DRAFT_61992 [Rhizodiscina lignyota]|uniref:SUI1 domain-containing protein n=1 Tax=Rhizodiscina lignyota TaxID=1504668 RepID=A0A9P4I4N1_9PEZI|nr:hypothetical protein NA57DRAFT_61992 [Rhizodiscina lignyota]
MFKKKPTSHLAQIKALAPLRSSDRRKTADEVIADLGLKPVSKDDANEEEKAAAVAETTALRNALFPENTLSARFTTTAGPDLKPVSGTVYAGSQPGEEQRLLWVRIKERMYPTVYTLWRNSALLPLLHTPSIVVSKLQQGADLMTPGLAGPPFPPRAKKDAVVAIASTESPSVPVAVGVCEIDVSALQKVQGTKGHAVRIEHWMGDELWGWSASGKPGASAPESLPGWMPQEEDDIAEKMEDLDIEGEAQGGGVALGSAEPVSSREAPRSNGGVDSELIEEVELNEKELTTKDIDEAFRSAFIYGVYHHRQTNKDDPKFGLKFPLTQSLVMSTLVQPFLPAFTPAQTQALQIKKTSWKNIKKFIKSLDKQKLVRSKDRDGNEVVILDIDFDDACFLNFKPYRLPKKETAGGASQGRGDKDNIPISETSGDPSVGQKLQKLELFRPREKLAPIFEVGNADSHRLFTASELRDPINAYIELEKLVSPTNKALVNLNPVLATIFDSSASLDKQVLAKGSVPRNTLIERIRESCARFWIVLKNGETPHTAVAKPKSGNAPAITITLQLVGSGRKVTKVTGLEPYFIPPQPLADELRKTCAGSTSVEKSQGSSPKDPRMEVTVQGPQTDAVLKALEKRGVNRNWVELVDKTKKKK